MNIFGSCNCPKCRLETRFLVEKGSPDEFLMLGDFLNGENENTEDIECDYCQEKFPLHIIQIDNIISSFLNSNEYDSFKSGELKIEKAKEKSGIEKESKHQLNQLHENFYTPFEQHPLEKGSSININNQKWIIEHVFKKENIEKDISKRILSPSYDEYWYEVKNDSNQKRWCIVTNIEEEIFSPPSSKTKISDGLKKVEYESDWYEFDKNTEKIEEKTNGVLMIDPPFLKENDVSYDITDTLSKTTLLFEKMITDNYYMRSYQYISGIRTYVFNKEGELEVDIFGETMDETLEQIEEFFSIALD